jgi:hypothetical protein
MKYRGWKGVTCALLACACAGCGAPPGGHWQCYNERERYFTSVDLPQNRDSCTLYLSPIKAGKSCRYSRSFGKVSITHIRDHDAKAPWLELPQPLVLTYQYWSPKTVLMHAHPMLELGEKSVRLGRLRSDIAHGKCEL